MYVSDWCVYIRDDLKKWHHMIAWRMRADIICGWPYIDSLGNICVTLYEYRKSSKSSSEKEKHPQSMRQRRYVSSKQFNTGWLFVFTYGWPDPERFYLCIYDVSICDTFFTGNPGDSLNIIFIHFSNISIYFPISMYIMNDTSFFWY